MGGVEIEPLFPKAGKWELEEEGGLREDLCFLGWTTVKLRGVVLPPEPCSAMSHYSCRLSQHRPVPRQQEYFHDISGLPRTGPESVAPSSYLS